MIFVCLNEANKKEIFIQGQIFNFKLGCFIMGVISNMLTSRVEKASLYWAFESLRTFSDLKGGHTLGWTNGSLKMHWDTSFNIPFSSLFN